MRKLKNIKILSEKFENVGCTVVIGALGSVPKMNLKTNLKVIDVKYLLEMIRKCALLGSARILRKGLEV